MNVPQSNLRLIAALGGIIEKLAKTRVRPRELAQKALRACSGPFAPLAASLMQ